jgi:hypothetical protein
MEETLDKKMTFFMGEVVSLLTDKINACESKTAI